MTAELILIPEDPQQPEGAKECARFVARGLASIGIRVREQISLCTDRKELQKAITSALTQSNIVVTLGGLGPQQGYLAKTVLSQGLKLPLEENAQCLESIRAYCERTGEPFLPEDRALAMLPRGSRAFPGKYGKLPGCAISSSKQHIILLPDDQAQTAAILSEGIYPYLSGSAASSTAAHTVRTYGLKPDQVRALLGELMDTANPAVTLQQDGGEVLVRVSAHAQSGKEAASLITPVLREAVTRLGDAAYGLDVDSLQSATVKRMQKKELDLAVAESGSDGSLTRTISETVGGSDILRYTVNVESDEAKTEKLGLDPKLLKRSGVTEQVAVHMADAARRKAGATLGVGITANTSDEKNKKSPIGTVYIAVCDTNTVTIKKLVVGTGDPMERDAVIDAAVSRALNMVRLFADYLPGRTKSAISLADALAGETVTGEDDDEADGSEKQEGFFSRNFIIHKADEGRVKVRKFIFILAVVVFLASGGYVGKYYFDSWRAARQARDLQNMFMYGEDVEISEDFPYGTYLAQFAALWTLNNDVVAYIDIPNTGVQYPIVQSYDNDYYLRRDFYENSNQHGIPFMDYRVDIERPSDNLVVYGHNMKDGTIFGELMSYKEGLDYYREHPTINFTTLYDAAEYKIFSVFVTNAYTSQGPVFEYHNFIDAASGEDFMNFVGQLQARSIINTTVDVQPGDTLLTLSTCSYEFKEARTVIVARRTRDGESPGVDTENAVRNPQPLYPDIWYQLFGGIKPSGVESYSIVTSTSTNPPSSTASQTQPVSTSQQEESQVESQQPVSSTAPSSTQEQQSQAESSADDSFFTDSQSSAPPPASDPEPPPPDPEPASQADPDPDDGIPNFRDSDDYGAGEQVLNFARAGTYNSTAGTEIGPDLFAEQEADYGVGTQVLQFSMAGASVLRNRVSVNTAAQAGIFDRIDVEQSIADNGEPYLSFDFTGPSSSSGGSEPSIFDRFKDDENFFHSGGGSSGGSSAGTLTVQVNGSRVSGDAHEIVARIVQNEIGSAFHDEAIKAQAVAAYTYILYYNAGGMAPEVLLSPANAVSDRVSRGVSQVLGQAVYYNNNYALTTYHATSAGQTTSSASVWGGSVPYLVSVDSRVDENTTHYAVSRTWSSAQVSEALWDSIGVQTYGDPSAWFEVLSYTDGGYNDRMAVCGETTTARGSTITGRILRENVLNLRSAAFRIDYDHGSDTFTFTSYGYGHGVGMSQNGANLYAQQGWDYRKILEHYFPGTTVR